MIVEWLHNAGCLTYTDAGHLWQGQIVSVCSWCLVYNQRVLGFLILKPSTAQTIDDWLILSPNSAPTILHTWPALHYNICFTTGSTPWYRYHSSKLQKVAPTYLQALGTYQNFREMHWYYDRCPFCSYDSRPRLWSITVALEIQLNSPCWSR